MEAAQQRWREVGTAYLRGEVTRDEARSATLDYDIARALLEGTPEIVRAVDIQRARRRSDLIANS